MVNKLKKYAIFLILLLFIITMLGESQLSIALACNGLNIWFEKMIPTLFPFMIISNFLLKTNLSQNIAKIMKPILYPLFQLSDHCIYCIVMGFLCGFPMGAKVIGDSYKLGKITKNEATLLLAFCNNIGPLYTIGYLIPLFAMENPVKILLILYGVPFGYGVFLRWLHSFQKNYQHDTNDSHTSLTTRAHSMRQINAVSDIQILTTLDDAIQSAIPSIVTLGGYMIFFNMSMIFVYLYRKQLSSVLYGVICTFVEITGGSTILSQATTSTIPILLLFPIGGISCIAQTASMIKGTDLSIINYLLHKIIQTVILFVVILITVKGI